MDKDNMFCTIGLGPKYVKVKYECVVYVIA